MSAAVFSGHCSECASSVRSQDTVMIWSIFRIKDKLNCETYWYSVALKMQGLSCLEPCARYTFGASILRLWGPLLQTSPAQWRTDKELCYIAGIFFPTALALIGYFEVKWHLTMKLFPAKISERATLQKSMTSEGNSALLPANVDQRLPLQRGLQGVPKVRSSTL